MLQCLMTQCIKGVRKELGAKIVDKSLVEKMIRNCLYQYQHTVDSVPLSKKDYEEMYEQIMEIYGREQTDINEIIQDVVYEYLTK